MRRSYSLYEAKARLSEIIRLVRERGESVVVSYHGEPVAEIRPITSPSASALETRLAELEARGVLGKPTDVRVVVKPVARRRGALRRFLDDRE